MCARRTVVLVEFFLYVKGGFRIRIKAQGRGVVLMVPSAIILWNDSGFVRVA